MNRYLLTALSFFPTMIFWLTISSCQKTATSPSTQTFTLSGIVQVEASGSVSQSEVRLYAAPVDGAISEAQ
ncbi:MAG: hypothetical protein ABH878_03690, partial [bacterium]